EPIRVAADRELVERMVQPLVDNAIRYGRTRVDVSGARSGSAAPGQVGDHRSGVADAEGGRIIAPGARRDGAGGPGHAAGRRAAAGTGNGAGLGLALARRIARSAGGEVTVTPSPDGGRFTLRLPVAR